MMQSLSLSSRTSGLKRTRFVEHPIGQTHTSRRRPPLWTASLVLALLVIFFLPVHAGAEHGFDVAAPPMLNTVPVASSSGDNLLQLTAGGHVLGFASDAAWLATGSHALRVGFDGANAVTPQSETAAAASGQAAALERVTYANLWDGVTLIYEADNGAVAKSTYLVAPGADPAQIRLRYNAPVELQADGSLRLRFHNGWMTESAPVAWQEVNGRRAPVDVAFREDGQTVSFTLGDYDPARPLTIDPVYAWHTFYGSIEGDYGRAIARDADGNLYIAGHSDETWNGDGDTPPLHAHSARPDITVFSLTSAGAYRWHTFYGGNSGNNYGRSITLDGNGNLYVAGDSYADWTGDGDGEALHSYAGLQDIVVLSLTTEGTYRWHTFYGGNRYDYGNAIVFDGTNNNLYVTGDSTSSWNGDSSAAPLHTHGGARDISVLCLTIDGTYRWHTFYGGNDDDRGQGIALDGSSNLYVTGKSGTTWDGDAGPLHAYSGEDDITVLSLTGDGGYRWHTFYGSSDDDDAMGIVYDRMSGNLYVTGNSEAAWDGDNTTAPLHARSSSGSDITVLKLTNTGAYCWHTFYGKYGYSYGMAITLDGSGNLYVSGNSSASWNGDNDTSPLHAHSRSTFDELTVLSLENDGNYRWHTFYGGSDNDSGQDILLDGSGTIYVVGSSYAPWNGDNDASPLHAFAVSESNQYDIALLTLRSNLLSYTVTPSPGTGGSVSPSTVQTVNSGATQAFTVTASFGYTTDSAVGGTCPTGSWNGSVYTTGAITADCTVSFSFTEIENPSFLLWMK